MLICNKCKEEIQKEYSVYPFNVRYWECTPVFSKVSTFDYIEYNNPVPKVIYCSKCFKLINDNNI